MESRKAPFKAMPIAAVQESVYDQETPRWRKYYLSVRKSIRFPRYYKRTLNW